MQTVAVIDLRCRRFSYYDSLTSDGRGPPDNTPEETIALLRQWFVAECAKGSGGGGGGGLAELGEQQVRCVGAPRVAV